MAIWDLNRAIYVRSIWHDRANGNCAIRSVAINESTVSHLDREFIISHKLNQFVTGIYRFLFGPQTVSAHHQCPSNRRARLGSFDESDYILNILGARIRAVRPFLPPAMKMARSLSEPGLQRILLQVRKPNGDSTQSASCGSRVGVDGCTAGITALHFVG